MLLWIAFYTIKCFIQINNFFSAFQLEVFAFLRNSSEAYCLHPFLALAFQSNLKWILLCLLLGLIGHINGTDVATVWKRIWKIRHLGSAPVPALHRVAMCLCIIKRSQASLTTVSSFERCGVPARLWSVLHSFLLASLQMRGIRNRKMFVEILMHVP